MQEDILNLLKVFDESMYMQQKYIEILFAWQKKCYCATMAKYGILYLNQSTATHNLHAKFWTK